ncbi:MAG TPA: cupin domain-containing protein [Gemmatimonadaceae bacterium]|jgi:transcriptional regulator with XRE-family HTH domain|nr:cupin domain-containing protein [Gemmatimonadaceae bacterium]
MQLGKKVRDLRLRRGMTVQQLAESTSLSKGFISQVENDRTSPSLSTLRDLARALETSVAYLVVEEEQHPHVVRANDRPRLPVGGNTSKVELLSALPKRNLELVLAELPPGVFAGDKKHFHHGEECLLCLEGRVSVQCGLQTLVLEQGDSCHFDGRVPHAVENTGDRAARVLIAITPAAFEPMIRVREPHAERTAAPAGARNSD